MAFNPYKIAIELSLEDKVSGALAALTRTVLPGVEGGVRRLAKAFEEAGTASKALAGALTGVVGVGLLTTLAKTALAAKDLSHQLSMIRIQGVSPGDTARIKSAIMGVHEQVPGVASDFAGNIFSKIRSLVGTDDAIKLLVPLAKYSELFSIIKKRPPEELELRNLVKAADMIGALTDPKTKDVDINRFQHFLGVAGKAMIGTGGAVDPRTWFQLGGQGGIAMSNMSDKGLMTMAMLAQERSGFTAATALMSIFSQFQGGIMTPWRVKRLMEVGLLPKETQYSVTPGGHVIWGKGSEPRNTEFARAFAEDPLKGIEVYQKAITAAGYGDLKQQVPLLFELTQRQTSIRELGALLRNVEQFKGERGRLFGAMGLDEGLKYAREHDLAHAMDVFGISFHDMMIKLGSALTDKTISILNKLSKVFDAIGKWAQTDPQYIEMIAKGLALLGATFVGASGVALMAAIGPTGWVIGFFIAFAGLQLWTKGEEIKAALKYMDDLANVLAGKLGNALKAAADAFNNFADWLMGKMRDIGRALHLISAQGGGGLGGEGGLGAITKASYSTGTVADYIRQSAVAHGIDPNTALAVFKQESGFNPNALGDSGSSHGVAQLRIPGEGSKFLARGGSLAPSAWRSQIDYSMGRIAEGGWTPWRGARDLGISRWQGIHPNHGRIGTVRPHRGGGGDIVVDMKTYLDGRQIAESTSNHIMNGNQHSMQAPHFDGRGMYSGPDRQMNTG